MTDKIYVNQDKVEEHAAQIGDAAHYLADIPLVLQDARTTIPANAKGKAAYGRSQERIAGLGVLLDQEVKNIRGLNAAFAEFDVMMGELAKRGVSYAEK